MLNAIYTYASEHRDLYPGVQNPGAQATKEAVEGATGLTINYWVLIDLKGFESLVDSVGGITMDVYRRVPIGGGSTEDPRLRRSGQEPAPQRLRGTVVRPFTLGLFRLRPDAATEVRHERNAQPVRPDHRADEVQQDRRSQPTGRSPPTSQPRRGRHHDRSRAQSQAPAGFECGHDAAADRSELAGLRPWSPHTVQKRIAASEAIDRPVAEPTPASTPSAQPSPNPQRRRPGMPRPTI